MTLQISAPSKTFLLGEYLALNHGPCLLLNTAPRFKLTVTETTGRDFKKMDEQQATPAAKFLQNNWDFFRNFQLEFYDPYHGLGGFGASSAEFCLLYKLKQYYEKTNLNWTLFLQEYQAYAWNKQGLCPSGADLIAQMQGGITYFQKENNTVEKIVWPFPDLIFCLIHTHKKLSTYQHLRDLTAVPTAALAPIVAQAYQALTVHNKKDFIAAIHDYRHGLQANKLVTASTLKMLNTIETLPGVMACKGCGALGADVILALIDKNKLEKFIINATALELDIMTLGCHADEGVLLENGKNNEEQVILVNSEDLQTDVAEKFNAHKNGVLHRAFSIFIFRKIENRIEVLLQQRAKHKYHCAGLWSNTCCSHPHPGEDTLISAHNRLKDEMGIDTALHEIGSFCYKADLANGLIEHEVDHVFIGKYEGDLINSNLEEVNACQWLSIEKLRADIKNNPTKYTPWLEQALQLIINKKAIREYLF